MKREFVEIRVRGFYSAKATDAKKAAELLRRNGREVQLRKAKNKSERRVVVPLKRGESYWAVQSELERKVRAMFVLGGRSKQSRIESAKRAAETRLTNKLEDKLVGMNRGFVFEILRDFVLKPKHYRKQKIGDAPRKRGAEVRGAIDNYRLRSNYEIPQNGERQNGERPYVSFKLSALVSRNIALEVVEKYQGYTGFKMWIKSYDEEGGVYIDIEVQIPLDDINEVSQYEKLGEIYTSGVYKPQKA